MSTLIIVDLNHAKKQTRDAKRVANMSQIKNAFEFFL